MNAEASVRVLHKDKTETSVDLDKLVKHLQNMGLRSRHVNDGRVLELTLREDAVSWVNFEIVENNDSVVMEVNRGDNTVTRCYLKRSFFNPTEIYVQVTSGVKPDEFHPAKSVEDAEVDGIFPLEIRAIGTGFSSNTGKYIGFYGKDLKSGIQITEDGRVRFSWP